MVSRVTVNQIPANLLYYPPAEAAAHRCSSK